MSWHWPWVSRGLYRACAQALHREEARVRLLTAALADAQMQADIANAIRRDEQWRRIKAEGEVQYRDERIRRVLGLPGFKDEP